MRYILSIFAAISIFLTPMEATVVVIETCCGNIVVNLDEQKAPITVKNFLQYVDDGHYNGTIFHRVINDFMIQGGGYTQDMKQKPTRAPIKNESSNGLKNKRGTIAMARTNDLNSATAQFYINVVDNAFLDNGYCVFGKVVEGMEVVDKIKKAETHAAGGHGNVPVKTVEIRAIVRKS